MGTPADKDYGEKEPQTDKQTADAVSELASKEEATDEEE